MQGQDHHRPGSDSTLSGGRQLQTRPEAPDPKRTRLAAHTHVTPCLVAHYFRENDTKAKSEKCYLAISADVHIKPFVAGEAAPQALSEFRGRRNTTVRLARMSEEDAEKKLARRPDVSLARLVEGLVGEKDGFNGRALRVRGVLGSVARMRGKQEWVVLVAASEEQRDAWLRMLQMIVAPWSVLEKTMRAALSSTTPRGPSAAANAAGGSLQTTRVEGTGAVNVQDSASSSASPGAAAEDQSSLVASFPGVSGVLATVAESGHSVAAFGTSVAQAVADIAGTADKLGAQLGSFALVGPAFLGLSVLARTTQMIASARANEPKLEAAHRIMHGIQRDLAGVLLAIFDSGFRDKRLVEKVFRLVEGAWGVIVLIERHMVKSFVGRALKANEVDSILASVEQLTDKVFAVGLSSRVAELEGDMRELKSLRGELQAVAQDVERNKEAIEGLQSSLPAAKREDFFQASFSTIPKLSRPVIETGIPGLEALKECVLSSSSVAASGVAAKGSGGVGKTTACIAVACSVKVQAHFSDGIYFMTLGEAATDASVVSEVSRIVADCGGMDISEKIDARPNDIVYAVDHARRWFRRRQVLLIADNIWPSPVSGSGRFGWARTLASIVDEGPRRCFLFSTRMPDLASFAKMRINFEWFEMGSVDGREGAVSMFELYASIERGSNSSTDPRFGESNQKYQAALEYVLQICGGWQLLLAMAGAFAEACDYHWDGIRADLEKHLLSSNEGSGAVGHDGFGAIMKASLTFVDRATSLHPKHRLFQTLNAGALQSQFGLNWFTNIYASLSIYEAPRSVLIPVLAVQLKVEESQARALARLFKRMSLASLWEEEVDDVGTVLRLALHDMQYSYSMNLCGESDYRPNQCDMHEGFLVRVSEEIGEGASGRAQVNWGLLFEGGRCIWRDYCRIHLARHMLASVGTKSGGEEPSAQRRAEDVVSFLTDFRWMRGCGKVRGRGGLLVDYHMFLKGTKRWPASVQTAREAFFGAIPPGARRALQAVREVLSVIDIEEFEGDVLCEEHGTRRDRGLASQLYGRLKGVGRGEAVSLEDRDSFQRVVWQLQESIVAHARRPWLRATSDCYDVMGVAGTHWKESFSVSGGISRVAFLDLGVGMRVFVSGGNDGKVRLHDLDDVGMSAVELGAHKSRVTGLAVSNRGGSGGFPLVASCSRGEMFCIWDLSPVLKFLREDSPDGARISAVDENLCVSRLLGDAIPGYSDSGLPNPEVPDIAISSDGSRVLATGFNGKNSFEIHLWTRLPRSLNGKSAVGASAWSYDHRVIFKYRVQRGIGHIAISKGGEVALHCGKASGVLRAWRSSDGMLLYTSNVLHNPAVSSLHLFEKEDDVFGDRVSSILLSDDAVTLCAGTFDGAIQVFDTRLQKLVGCMHSEKIVTSLRSGISMAFVEHTGPGEGASPATHLLSVYGGEAIARWNVEAQSLLAVYGDGASPGTRRVEWGLTSIAVRRGAPAETGAVVERGKEQCESGTPSMIDVVNGHSSGKVSRWTVEKHFVDQKENRSFIFAADEAEGEFDIVVSTRCSPDGRYLACGMDSGRVSLWHADERGRKWMSKWMMSTGGRGNGENVIIDISSDNALVACCDGIGKDILLLNGDSGEKNRLLVGHQCGVRCVIFTRGGKCLASGDEHGGVLLWDMNARDGPLELKASSISKTSQIDFFATAAASKVGGGGGCYGDILISVDSSGSCLVWSLVDLKLLFSEALKNCNLKLEWRFGAGVGFMGEIASRWGWHIVDWRERQYRSMRKLSMGSNTFPVGLCSPNGGRIGRIVANAVHGAPGARGSNELVLSLGPTARFVSHGFCSCLRSRMRFDSQVKRGSPFLCCSAALDTPARAAVDDKAVVDNFGHSLQAGTVLIQVGCGLQNGKLATFQLLEDSRLERKDDRQEE